LRFDTGFINTQLQAKTVLRKQFSAMGAFSWQRGHGFVSVARFVIVFAAFRHALFIVVFRVLMRLGVPMHITGGLVFGIKHDVGGNDRADSQHQRDPQGLSGKWEWAFHGRSWNKWICE
jgi:hypothetical protein